MNEENRLAGGSPGIASAADPIGTVAVDPDRLLTVDEAAALLSVAPSWIRSKVREDQLPHVRLGRWVRFRRSTLLAWVEGLER